MEKIKEYINVNEYSNYIKPISDKIIAKLNKILEQKNQDLAIEKLEKLKKYAKKKYKKIKNNEQKEIFINILLENITKLLNELNYKDIYNTDSIIWKEVNYYSQISDIKKIATLSSDKNIEGGDCNSQLLYFYNLVKSITNNDSYIKYKFFSDKRDNHWKIYIITKKHKYLYHRQSQHILIKTNNSLENKKIQIEDNNEYWYIKTKNNIWLNQNKISYRFWKKYLQIKSTFYWIKLKIKSSEKEVPHIKVKWLKKISKKIYKTFNFIYLWKKKRFKNMGYNQLINYIVEQIENKEDKIFFQETVKKFNKEKLINIFWLKAGK